MDDIALRRAVLDELESEPSVDAAHIGVAAEGGVVTLTGHVHSYAEKIAADRAVRRVRGVRAIAQEIEVRPPGEQGLSDDEIARRVLDVIAWNAAVSADTVAVEVQKGWVVLAGEVNWNFQRAAVEAAVRGLSGVVGISNRIALKVGTPATEGAVRKKIKDALGRKAELDAGRIRVSVRDGDTVTLEGEVQTLEECWLLERAAWSVPGVRRVEDRLTVA